MLKTTISQPASRAFQPAGGRRKQLTYLRTAVSKTPPLGGLLVLNTRFIHYFLLFFGFFFSFLCVSPLDIDLGNYCFIISQVYQTPDFLSSYLA
jgi:hypothetical protein